MALRRAVKQREEARLEDRGGAASLVSRQDSPPSSSVDPERHDYRSLETLRGTVFDGRSVTAPRSRRADVVLGRAHARLVVVLAGKTRPECACEITWETCTKRVRSVYERAKLRNHIAPEAPAMSVHPAVMPIASPRGAALLPKGAYSDALRGSRPRDRARRPARVASLHARSSRVRRRGRPRRPHGASRKRARRIHIRASNEPKMDEEIDDDLLENDEDGGPARRTDRRRLLRHPHRRPRRATTGAARRRRRGARSGSAGSPTAWPTRRSRSGSRRCARCAAARATLRCGGCSRRTARGSTSTCPRSRST